MIDETFELILLKQDLEILHDAQDDYLTMLLKAAEENILREGIILNDREYSASVVVAQYAAWMYRKRKLDTAPMPRMLRYTLNNMLIKQKAGGNNV